MIRLLHVITDLDTGGAERMLYRLLSKIDRECFDCSVISLTDCGVIGERIKDLGIPVQTLAMRRGVTNPLSIIHLTQRIVRYKPDVIQTWMYHADLIGGLASVLAGRTTVVWNIRHTDLDPQTTKRTTVWTASVCAKLSKLIPKRIVCCSHASRDVHRQLLGYDAVKMVVIPNGFDTESFYPDKTARGDVRRELMIPAESLIVGMVARYHPQKDHPTFFRMAQHVSEQMSQVHFVLCGDGIDADNERMLALQDEYGLVGRCHLLGRRSDVPRLMAAMDVLVSSSSHGEGFPNVVGEAMACGVPCVVTDVGDSARIVGDTGIVVQPRDDVALSGACQQMLELDSDERLRLGMRARQRIVDKFGIDKSAHRYEMLYHSLISVTDHESSN